MTASSFSFGSPREPLIREEVECPPGWWLTLLFNSKSHRVLACVRLCIRRDRTTLISAIPWVTVSNGLTIPEWYRAVPLPDLRTAFLMADSGVSGKSPPGAHKSKVRKNKLLPGQFWNNPSLHQRRVLHQQMTPFKSTSLICRGAVCFLQFTLHNCYC